MLAREHCEIVFRETEKATANRRKGLASWQRGLIYKIYSLLGTELFLKTKEWSFQPRYKKSSLHIRQPILDKKV